MNGEILPADQAAVSVYDHGLLYGDGVFEGLRFYGGVVFRLEAHLRRLQRSARALALDLPYQAGELARAMREAVGACGAAEGYIRLVITRGPGALGIDPRSCGRANVFVLVDQLTVVDPAVRQQGARLVLSSLRRLGPDGLDPRIKSLNYLNQILARIEANQVGADEAVLLNEAGYIAEGTVDNLFIVEDGVLATPPVSDGALDGITRGAVLEVAAELGVPTVERHLAAYDLYNADECFLTGTGAELIPVGSIGQRRVGIDERPVFERLQAGFADLVGRETQREQAGVEGDVVLA
ncbi:MAG: branched-chain-amino-acid transaminase [Candidatus Latescibacteria bacterium]|nr:branched-chain-amino-acid transaminase [Candidatus Latescibacterota bacterium]